MRIVFVDTTLDESFIGGGHLFLPGLMKGLVERGHDVHLVTKGEPDARLQPLIAASKATVHIRPWRKKGLVQDLAPVFNNWLNTLQPDVYVISTSADIGWVVLPYLNPRIATYTLGHNNEETYYLPLRHYHPFITTAVGVSEEICDQYKQHCHMAAGDVDWIPYGVEVASELSPTSKNGPLRLIYVGRIEEGQKRISDLIAIVIRLRERSIDFRLKIVGDGPEMPALKQQLAPEIASGSVEATGWLQKAEVIEQLRSADIFLLTSAFEGFSIALTEAMANGCCPLVTDIKSGNQQLITPDENGFLLPVGDIAGFADTLSELSENREKLSILRNKAWQKGAQFGTGRMVSAYEESFQKAMQKCKSHPRVPDAGFPLMSTCVSRYPNWLRRIKLLLKNN